jgi:hypothetical protein
MPHIIITHSKFLGSANFTLTLSSGLIRILYIDIKVENISHSLLCIEDKDAAEGAGFKCIRDCRHNSLLELSIDCSRLTCTIT